MEDEDEQIFLETLEKLRGTCTIVMITQRPSHMRICDRLLVLNRGQIEHLGPPDQVLDAMFAPPPPPQKPQSNQMEQRHG